MGNEVESSTKRVAIIFTPTGNQPMPRSDPPLIRQSAASRTMPSCPARWPAAKAPHGRGSAQAGGMGSGGGASPGGRLVAGGGAVPGRGAPSCPCGTWPSSAPFR